MFWACKPPSSTFPTMPLEASSMVYARMLKVLLLVTKATYLNTGTSVAVMRIFLK